MKKEDVWFPSNYWTFSDLHYWHQLSIQSMRTWSSPLSWIHLLTSVVYSIDEDLVLSVVLDTFIDISCLFYRWGPGPLRCLGYICWHQLSILSMRTWSSPLSWIHLLTSVVYSIDEDLVLSVVLDTFVDISCLFYRWGPGPLRCLGYICWLFVGQYLDVCPSLVGGLL